MKGSPVKMLLAGMAVMLLVLKPEVGAAIVISFVNGAQHIAEALNNKTEKIEKEEENILENNNAVSLILDEILQEFKSLKDKPTQVMIEEREVSILSKKQSYTRALEEQEIREKLVAYHGDDPIVRNRLNLPPKLPSFEQWNPTVEMFDKEFNAKFGSR